MGKIGLIARREFNERVKKKSFIITTILMPVLFVGIMVVMVYMMSSTGDKVREVIVVDASGIIAGKLTDERLLKFRTSDDSFDTLREQRPEGVFGILLIPADVMTNSRNLQLYTYEASTVSVESSITGQLQKIIEDEKLKAYNIENLSEILEQVKTRVTLQTKEFTDSGEAKDSSTAFATVAATIFGLLIYMFVLLYGTMVMQGVIEEKSNKVIELMVSSAKPFQLMMGKILGIDSVAITQLLIWVVFIVVVGGVVMNFFAGDMMEAAAAMQSGGAMPAELQGLDMEDVALLSRVTDLGYMGKILLSFLLYFVGGYLLYAAMFAAVGSSVDNEKDTSNLQLPITIPLILAFVVTFSVIREPNSSVAMWFSMIPFTSPIVMMARLPYGVPGWELILSLVLLYATFVAMVWLASKIYRVGIFMYGKKPTFKELYKWMRYKY